MIVCLGSGIRSMENFPVATTVNQCYLQGDVIAKEKAEKAIPAESSLSFHPLWILHGQTGYFFPDGGNLRLETKTAPGSWNQVALMYKPETISAGIFKLWFDHAQNPVHAKYAYILVPGATRERLQRMESKPAFTIPKNDTTVQAVVSSDKSIGGAIFYEAGKIDLSGMIEVDSPCVLMVKRSGMMTDLSVSDPTHQLKQIQLTLSGIYEFEGSTSTFKKEKKRTIVTIILPKGGEAGKTVTLMLRAL
jgi:chondroitin AC lyase